MSKLTCDILDHEAYVFSDSPIKSRSVVEKESFIGQYNSLISHLNAFSEYKGNDITVGIVDTGIEINHEYFSDGCIIDGKSFTSNENIEWNINNNFHCTGVASMVKSVAPNVKFVIAKAMDSEGKGYLDDIANAINWLVSRGDIDIINLSIGSTVNSVNLENAVKNAINNNISVVVAIGNEGDGSGLTKEYSYPSAYDCVIAVGSITKNYTMSSFSNTNRFCDFVAVGDEIRVAYDINEGKSRYAKTSGTSFSCPIIVGFMAILIEKFKADVGRRPCESEVYGMLCKYSREINGLTYDEIGQGFIDFAIKRIKK